MIDERTLTDATRCPSCNGPLLGSTTCTACAVDLSGPTARAVWHVSLQAAGLLAERNRLISVLRVEASTHASDPAAPPQMWTPQHPTHRTAGVSESTNGAQGPPRVPAPAAPAMRPAPEWTRRKVQNLLLSLGVGLLAVAAVIFLIVSWSVLGIGGRAAVMTACTVLAGGGAAFAHRRGLGSTAEAVSLLAVGLGLLDAVGARSAGLAGFDRVDGLLYWAGALVVVAACSAATAVVVPTRSLRVAAAALGQLPAALLTAHLAEDSGQPAAVTAAGLTLAAVAGLGLAAAWRAGAGWRDARVVVACGSVLVWLVACGAALVAAYGEAGSLVPGTALLVTLAIVAAGAVLVDSRFPLVATAGVTAAAGLLLAAAWAVPVDRVDDRWLPVVLSGVAVALLAAAVAVPRRHRRAPALVALAASVLPVVAALSPAAAVLFGRLSWLDRPWQGVPHGSARDMLTVLGYGTDLSWGTEIPLLLACVGVALVIADRLHGLRPIALAALPLAALAASTLPVALDVSLELGVMLDLSVAVALVLPGTWLLRRGHAAWGTVGAATGLVVLGLAVTWSLALQAPTLAALATAAVLLAAGAVIVGDRAAVAPLRLGLGIAATLSAVGEVAAFARAEGAGWPAVWSLALALCALAASAGAVLLAGSVRRGFAVTATVSVLGEAAALTVWGGGSAASAGLAVTVTAAVLGAAAVWSDTLLAATGRTPSTAHTVATPPLPAGLIADVTAVAVLGGVIGVAFAALDADRLWLALLAAGVATAVVSLRSGLHRVGWAAGGLLAASSWVRLVLSDVEAPEPYTVPAGVALVALGLWRRRDPAYSSWRAYGAGLGLALVPSLIRALSDPGNLRPMLLGLAAAVVLCSGIARRLKAPLMLGGAVLAVDAVVQLSPHLVLFYSAVPRWSMIAGAGLLLLFVGMTYERRAQELLALRQQVSRFN